LKLCELYYHSSSISISRKENNKGERERKISAEREK